MHINLESAEKHAVQAYTDHQIQIDSIVYERSLIVSKEEIITDLTIQNIREINEDYLKLLLRVQPEVIIIGHGQTGVFPDLSIISQLSQQRIGIESMSIGAASRTYNVLLGEQRAVVAGFIFAL